MSTPTAPSIRGSSVGTTTYGYMNGEATETTVTASARCAYIAVDHEGLQAVDRNSTKQMRMKCDLAILDRNDRLVEKRGVIIGPGTYAEVNTQKENMLARMAAGDRI